MDDRSYDEIESVGVDRTLILDGWAIHRSVRGGWVWRSNAVLFSGRVIDPK